VVCRGIYEVEQTDDDDIFAYWAQLKPGEHVHPEDREALARMQHPFDLTCLPGCWRGPLRTAAVVLLYLAPGWTPKGPLLAQQESSILQNSKMRTGDEPLPEWDETKPGLVWLERRTRVFGEWERLRTRLAILNIVPYQSPGEFKGYKLIKALPSCQISLEWAHDVLFPQARRSERVVVCLRSAKRWGLQPGTRDGLLFAPQTNRGGHMLHEPMRDDVISNVRFALGGGSG
jgi:hypothetical protein